MWQRDHFMVNCYPTFDKIPSYNIFIHNKLDYLCDCIFQNPNEEYYNQNFYVEKRKNVQYHLCVKKTFMEKYKCYHYQLPSHFSKKYKLIF